VQACSVPVHFHFLIGQAQGLTYPNVQRVVAQYLGDHVTVYPHQHYVAYMDIIAGCDMFINPFPFGNTNGIIDTISAGLVGVCKTGPEVHEHIDEGLFRRLGLPDWLIAKTEDEYVLAAVRLATNHQERLTLREQHSGEGKVDVLFQGRPNIMGEEFLRCLETLKS
jgi:predicted O-linked N-acetylglucosamine transferase (SPINDLY family)